MSDNLQPSFSDRKDKQRVLDAIDTLKGEATPALVVETTGLPVSEATYWLNKIASETGGHLRVLDDGGIVYKFDPGFRNVYIAGGIAAALLAVWSILFDTGFWLLRMSFGFMLILSVLVVVVLVVASIVAMIAAACASADGGGDVSLDLGGAGDAASSAGDGIWHLGRFDIGDLFTDTWRWDYAHNHQRQVQRQQEQGHFFLACFSFLFGDGDPNVDHERNKWLLVSQLLQDRGGVIAAEELTPLTGRAASDEQGIFEALSRFGGYPEVTPNGNIVYLFPGFHRHLPPQSEVRHWLKTKRKRPLDCFQEAFWSFSSYGFGELFMVALLASVNLAGSWWLYKHILTINFLHHIALFIDVLLGFASLFVLVPLCRVIHHALVNLAIRGRNELREQALDAYFNHSPELGRTLADCEQIRFELAGLRQPAPQIVYTTEKDALEQEFDNRA